MEIPLVDQTLAQFSETESELDILSNTDNTDIYNTTLKDYNEIKNPKKRKTKGKQTGQKFPMPRQYKPNKIPDREKTFLEITNEMIQMYDNQNQPKHYENFINESLQKQKKLKSKAKPYNERIENDVEYNKMKQKIEEKFENLEIYNFELDTDIIIPVRSPNFLPYLDISVGTETEIVQIISLKDSGASHTILEIDEFKKLPNYKNITVQAKKLNMVTPNGTSQNAIQGEVTLDLNIKDVSGKIFTIKQRFLLAHLGGNQKCILGYDFLSREQNVIGETPRHIFLTQNGVNFAIEILKRNISKGPATPSVQSVNHIIIPPNTMQPIELKCASTFQEIKSFDSQDCIFIPHDIANTVQNYGLVLEPCLVTPRKRDDNTITFTAQITNFNNEEMNIGEGEELGNLEELKNTTQMTTSENDFKILMNSILVPEATHSIPMNDIEFIETEQSDIFTYQIIEEQETQEEEPMINSMFNRKENIEKESILSDGSVRTQLIKDVEDILRCDTSIDPEELLDKEEKLTPEMANYSAVPEEYLPELQTMVKEEMKTVWSKHKWDIGVTDKIEHHMETEEGEEIKDKKRPIPYNRLQYAKKAVNTLYKYNLVKPITDSKWGTNLVLVQKPATGTLRDTTKASQIHNKAQKTACTWRLAQDLRGPNKKTKNILTATLPTIDEIVNKCRDKIVTCFDINQAYYHIKLSKQSMEKTAFYLNDSMWAWTRMTQGLAGAPHSWMKFMQIIFNDDTLQEYKQTFPVKGKLLKENHWDEFLSIYMDDLNIFSASYAENLIHIHAVLWIMGKENCLLNPKKAVFMTTEFNCLGVTINTKDNQVSIDRKRSQAILSWPKPSCLLEVMSRLQTLNYCSKNLPRLKEIAYPLLDMLRKKEFVWKEEHEISWEHIKNLIKMDIRLSIPNDNLDYITTSDTSKIAVAGNLFNYDPEVRKLYLLGCMSKLLSLSDSLKAPFQKECLALSLNLKNWECYILGTERRIISLCDARGILWLHRNKEFSNKLTTISLFLSQFKNLTIWHIPGPQNVLADIFSRSYHGSAHKAKDDFKLSKNQAQILPPLPNPCILDQESLFEIFISLPQSEPDFDTGNKKRRSLPTPKPLLNILKQVDKATPEEKFISARRVLEGWNHGTLTNNDNIITNTLTTQFEKLENSVETEYLTLALRYIEEEVKTDFGAFLTMKIKQRLDGENSTDYSIQTLKESISNIIPENKNREMKEIITKSLMKDENQEKSDTVQYLKVEANSITPTVQENILDIKSPINIRIQGGSRITMKTGIMIILPQNTTGTLISPYSKSEINISQTVGPEKTEKGLTLLIKNNTNSNFEINRNDTIVYLNVNTQNTELKFEEIENLNGAMLLSILVPDIIPLITLENNIQIKLPNNLEMRKACIEELEINKDNEETIELCHTLVNILENVNNENTEENKEQHQRTQERRMATIADIFQNKGRLSKETLKKLQEGDTFCNKIIQGIKIGKNKPSYSLLSDILMKEQYDKMRKCIILKIVIPNDLMTLVCKAIHNDDTLHQPLTGCINTFKKHFYNKTLEMIMNREIQNCIIYLWFLKYFIYVICPFSL